MRNCMTSPIRFRHGVLGLRRGALQTPATGCLHDEIPPDRTARGATRAHPRFARETRRRIRGPQCKPHSPMATSRQVPSAQTAAKPRRARRDPLAAPLRPTRRRGSIRPASRATPRRRAPAVPDAPAPRRGSPDAACSVARRCSESSPAIAPGHSPAARRRTTDGYRPCR